MRLPVEPALHHPVAEEHEGVGRLRLEIGPVEVEARLVDERAARTWGRRSRRCRTRCRSRSGPRSGAAGRRRRASIRSPRRPVRARPAPAARRAPASSRRSCRAMLGQTPTQRLQTWSQSRQRPASRMRLLGGIAQHRLLEPVAPIQFADANRHPVLRAAHAGPTAPGTSGGAASPAGRVPGLSTAAPSAAAMAAATRLPSAAAFTIDAGPSPATSPPA